MYLFHIFYRLPPEPFTIEMIPSDNGEATIKFVFINESDEDLHLLKFYTPLEGLRSNFLSIKHSEKEENIKYEGVLVKRPSITRKEFIRIEKNEKKIFVIDVTEAYQLDEGEEYTVEYQRSLAYASEEGFSCEAPTYSFQEVSRQCKIKIKKTSKNTAKPKPLMEEQQHHDQVRKSLVFDGKFDEKTKKKIQELHELCKNEYQKVLDAVEDPDYSDIYEKWFAASDKKNVKSIYKKCLDGLNDNTIVYRFCEDEDEDSYGWTYHNSRTIVITRLFESLPQSSNDPGQDSQIQAVVHKLSRAFGSTDDNSYGPDMCQHFAQCHSQVAANNADNYGYLFQELMLKVSG